jgi:hypothetical protein
VNGGGVVTGDFSAPFFLKENKIFSVPFWTHISAYVTFDHKLSFNAKT